MTGRQILIFLSGVLITLIFMKPTVPVFAGSALLILAAGAYRIDLCQASAQKRWASFKRIAGMALLGGLLVAAGTAIGPLSSRVDVSNGPEMRHVMAYMVLYCLSFIGAPVLVWTYLSQREPRTRRRVRQGTDITTLSSLARSKSTRNIGIAV